MGTDLIVELGTLALIPIYHSQKVEEYYPNPEDLDSARFSKENKIKISRIA